MAKLPLEGVRVADFTWVWAGPYCTLQLAHLGAEVIRIETRTRPCITRVIPPWPEGKPGGLNRSGYFNQYNQGKRSLALNFSKPGTLEIARRLVAKSDVVTNNFAHGVMDRLGLGYEQLKAIKRMIDESREAMYMFVVLHTASLVDPTLARPEAHNVPLALHSLVVTQLKRRRLAKARAFSTRASRA